MAYSDYLNYIENLKNDFIKTYNKPYTGDEYFKVAIKTWYDDYDGYEQKGITTTLDLCIKTGTYTETFKKDTC